MALELVELQVKDVPEPFKGEAADKTISFIVVPSQTVVVVMELAIGFGLIVTVYDF